jgi:hypothetical protein
MGYGVADPAPARNVTAMTSGWLVLAAALGASALTGAISLTIFWLQELRRQRAADQAELQAAMEELLSRSSPWRGEVGRWPRR